MFRAAPGIGLSVITQYCACACMPAVLQAVQAVCIWDWRHLGRYQAIPTAERGTWPGPECGLASEPLDACTTEAEAAMQEELWSP